MKPTILNASILLFVLMGGSTAALAAPTDNPISEPAAHSIQALPPTLRPVLYQTLAKNAGAAYNLNGKGCATLPKQAFKACFDNGGAHFSGAGSLALHIVAYGRNQTLTPVSRVQPTIEGNHASYAYGNLTAWWRVLPVGFEQGFTITKRSAGRSELKLVLATNNQARQRNGALTWGKLRYGGLVVTDAKGKVIRATLRSKGDRVLIAVNDAHATYPLTVDPLVWLEQKVTASDGVAHDEFGYVVAVSGTTALVGVPDATVNGNTDQGAAYVFTDSGGTWTQAQKLTASDGAVLNLFGLSVAVSGDTALIGAPDASINGNITQGAAYVFTDTGGTWVQTQKLIASDGTAHDQFGWACALSEATALVGAPPATINGNTAQGAVYVFGKSGGTWNQTAKLTASDGATGDLFGLSIALDDMTALIGAPQGQIGVGGTGPGAAYVFANSGGSWTQVQKLSATDGETGDVFGGSVALSGTTALVGAAVAVINGNFNQGAAYMFSNSGGSWSQSAKLTASDGATNNYFGTSVALSGTTAFIGAPDAAVDGNAFQGTAYLFSDLGATWTQTQKFAASGSHGFGNSTAFDGATVLFGAFGTTVNGNSAQGAAYFYGESDLGLNVSAPQAVGQGQSYVSQAIATNEASAASPAVAVTVTVPAAASFVSASATQGSCSEDSGVVTCDFGQINGNAGTATANVTLKATGDVGDTIDNTASVAKATPSLSASAPTIITAGGACPDGYSEYNGTLSPGEVARSPAYQAPGGEENAILTAPERFQIYAVYQSGRYGRHVYLVPGNEVHRWGPKGLYMWLVRARDGAGAYTLCLQHP